MSASRAHKRRKLDDAPDSDQRHKSSPTATNSRFSTIGNAQSSPAVKSNSHGQVSLAHSTTPSKPASSHEIWKQAKAAQREISRKSMGNGSKSKIDLYDDIEGANVGREPYGRIGGRKAQARGDVISRPVQRAEREISRKSMSNGSKNESELYDDIEGANLGREPYGRIGSRKLQARGDAVSSPAHQVRTPKMALDPLRNQKITKTTSPRKPVTAAVGFFKQFHRPPQSTAQAPKTKDASPKKSDHVNAFANTSLSQPTPALKERVIEESEQESDSNVETAQDVAATPSRSHNGKSQILEMAVTASDGRRKPSWTYGKKKTFEDEIRELEEQARKKADDASEDELASQSSVKRSSKRQPVQREIFKPTIVSRTPKPLDRRKESTSSAARPQAASKISPKDNPEYGMEIDDSADDEHINLVNVIVPDVKPASRSFTPKKKISAPQKSTPRPATYTFQPEHLRAIQRIVLEKATGRRAIPWTNLEDEYDKVFSLVNQTVTAGESNSILLIGARGCGKSAMTDTILRVHDERYPDDFHAVRLNGFIHTDDKIALREIWRQLGREMDLDDDEATSKNYADTMSKLLALLSHPAETGTEQPEQVTKSVVFVLDEFELFATHPRQTLLYNLFDIAQSRKAPIAVLGLTTRIDVAESLEKRVKSRFSHRYVHLGMPKNLASYKEICESAVMLAPNELESDQDQILGHDESGIGIFTRWNSAVSDILASARCSHLLQRIYATTKSVPDFLCALTLATASMPVNAPTTDTDLIDHFESSFSQPVLQPPDSKLSLLSSLSTLQLALLISAARLSNIYNTEIISFALAYEEYKGLASKAKLQASAAGALAGAASSRVWGKDVAKGAWEELIEAGLVMQDGRSGGKEVARVDVGLEEIGMCGVELGAWGRWCKEI